MALLPFSLFLSPVESLSCGPSASVESVCRWHITCTCTYSRMDGWMVLSTVTYIIRQDLVFLVIAPTAISVALLFQWAQAQGHFSLSHKLEVTYKYRIPASHSWNLA